MPLGVVPNREIVAGKRMPYGVQRTLPLLPPSASHRTRVLQPSNGSRLTRTRRELRSGLQHQQVRRRIRQRNQVTRSPIGRGPGLVELALRGQSPGQVGASYGEPLGLAQLADLVPALLQLGDGGGRVLVGRGGREPQPGTQPPEVL